MTDEKPPSGSAEQLEMALDAAIEESRSLCLELETLQEAAGEVVNAWHQGGDIGGAVVRLEAVLTHPTRTRQ